MTSFSSVLAFTILMLSAVVDRSLGDTSTAGPAPTPRPAPSSTTVEESTRPTLRQVTEAPLVSWLPSLFTSSMAFFQGRAKKGNQMGIAMMMGAGMLATGMAALAALAGKALAASMAALMLAALSLLKKGGGGGHHSSYEYVAIPHTGGGHHHRSLAEEGMAGYPVYHGAYESGEVLPTTAIVNNHQMSTH